MTRPAPAEADVPSSGLWRIGRSPDPLSTRPPEQGTLSSSRGGNRFDVTTHPIGVLYFASGLETCFAETLARFRPDPLIAAQVRADWERNGWMHLGSLPTDWRLRRMITHVHVRPGQPILDLTDLGTIAFLREELAYPLAVLGYNDLDNGLLRGPDRRISRLIADWAYAGTDTTRWFGIKYLSRLDDTECWAVFPDTQLEVQSTRPIPENEPGLQSIANRFELRVF